ncbi:MAG: hypothetical protein A2Y63_00720 [Candidatus Riflebacteria bacterium RBG_13_59_9]|nr:MAG: hypothetical protein A2Y63_00720 [Candidatus Riflebacteria bacterium RBG_13_59_9]
MSDPENLTAASWANTNSTDSLVEDYGEGKRFTRVIATATDGYVEQTVSFTGDGTKSIQGIFRKGTEAVESRLILRQTSGSAADRINVKVDWAAKTVTAPVGTLAASEWLDSDTVWFAAYGPGVVAAQTNKIRCQVKTSGAYSHFTGIQAQNTSYPVMLVQIAGSLKSYDIMLGEVVEETRYTDPDLLAGHRVITRNAYDKLGRLTRAQTKNTDADYGGDSQFKLVQETEYLDDENAVLTRNYVDEDPAGASFTQSKLTNDWLGRGVVRESTWPMKNGRGQQQAVENTYDLVGNLTQRRLPSGEEYRFRYSSRRALEKSSWPDGTYTLVGTDRNGRVTRNVDRRLLEVSSRYNKADLVVEVSGSDAVYGDIVRTIKVTHLGPAGVVESESGVEKVSSSWEYHWSGKPSKISQTVDSQTLTMEYGYDGGGNPVWMTPTGSGANPWMQRFNLKPQYHPVVPDTDAFNRTAIEKDGSIHVITRENDYLGLTKRIKYGDYGSTKGEVGLGYDKFLRLASAQSNEGSPALDINLTRDFTGNILSKEGNAYGYDGMNRLVSGEGEDTSYDELSSLSVRGPKRYSYQSAGEEGESQMRLESFDDGSNSFSYGYDNNGNVVSISGRFDSLVHDTMNRLREVSYHGSSQLDRYWYDGAGFRVKREERINVDANTTKIYSLYSGDNPLVQEKYVGSTRISTRLNIIAGGAILAQYEYVYGTGEVVRYFYLDQIGSRRVVKDSTGAVTDKFSYSAWGEKTHTQGTQGELASYTGKEYDATGLLYFNARYYDPTIGRFITEDPSRKGTGWYTYCSNNPINRTDPTGRYDPDDPGRQRRAENTVASVRDVGEPNRYYGQTEYIDRMKTSNPMDVGVGMPPARPGDIKQAHPGLLHPADKYACAYLVARYFGEKLAGVGSPVRVINEQTEKLIKTSALTSEYEVGSYQKVAERASGSRDWNIVFNEIKEGAIGTVMTGTSAGTGGTHYVAGNAQGVLEYDPGHLKEGSTPEIEWYVHYERSEFWYKRSGIE